MLIFFVPGHFAPALFVAAELRPQRIYLKRITRHVLSSHPFKVYRYTRVHCANVGESIAAYIELLTRTLEYLSVPLRFSKDEN